MQETKPNEKGEQPVYLRKNGWLTRLGCMLTGYNCRLLRQCSEASYKKLKKYTAAIMIVMIIWWFVGYLFSKEYFGLEKWQAVAAGTVAAGMVWMVERIIILSVGRNITGSVIRVMLGMVMAVVGATIVDQVIFREDIKKMKTFATQNEVDTLLPRKTAEVRRQIKELDSLLAAKDAERRRLLADLERHPVISVPTVSYTKDSTGRIVSRSVTVKKTENPKFEVYKSLEKQMSDLKMRRDSLGNKLIHIREVVEEDLMERKGFLDELKLMFRIITGDKVALGFWLLWLVLLALFEMMVVFTKLFDKETDYEYLVVKMNEMNKR